MTQTTLVPTNDQSHCLMPMTLLPAIPAIQNNNTKKKHKNQIKATYSKTALTKNNYFILFLLFVKISATRVQLFYVF